MTTAATERADRESAMCGCGHMRGIHKARQPYPCATAGCGCAGFGTRAQRAPASLEPPRVIPGRVERELAAGDGASPAAIPGQPAPEGGSAARNFALNLARLMRALGLTTKELGEKAGCGNAGVGIALGKAGERCVSLDVAEKLATTVGGYLAAMIGPYLCATCAGEPPKGFTCQECGTEAPRG